MDSLTKFQGLLRQLFQFDAADVDFGIYRILNYKREQVENFITRCLPQILDDAFEAYAKADKETLQQEIEQREREIREKFGKQAFDEKGQLLMVFRETPLGEKYLALQKKKEQYQVSEDLKTRVYNDLYTFFSRYYEDGDFIAKRRYGRHETYAIPYSGEEVVLHWATKDQYYIKTGERFKNYRFTIEGYTIVFELRNATTEQNNNNGDKRYFVLVSDNPVEWNETTKILTVYLEYRTLSDDEQVEYGKTEQQKPQDKLNENAAQAILEKVQDPTLKDLLKSKTDNEQSLLLKHLTRFTRKNTSDFFIHKNLRGFLQRELEFFIKSECLLLDELLPQENTDLPRQHILRGRVVREIGHKIIDFLAQVEDFQKRLFEKKKFVVRTDYCLTIDRIPESLWDEILQNEEQLKEWRELYDLDALLRKAGLFGGAPNREFLHQHRTLVVDTRHFSDDFKWRLLAHLDDLDDALDGVLIKSENFQALNLLMEKYRRKVKCIYIDPPYNTGNDGFLYKDRYQHSSWLSMMADRMVAIADLLWEGGVLFVSIDSNEKHHLMKLAEIGIGAISYLSTFVWINNLKGRQLTGRGAAGTHEYVLAFGGRSVGVFAASVKKLKSLMPTAYKGFEYEVQADARGSYVLKNELYNTNSKFNEETCPNLVFNIHYNFDTGEIKFSEVDDELELDGFVKISPKRNNNRTHKYHAWRWSREKILEDKENLEFVRTEDGVKIYTKVRSFEITILKDIITDISTSVGSKELSNLFGITEFKDYPKPTALVGVFVDLVWDDGIVADFFAGSGTTAHAVINLNRQDKGKRKYILVEMGDWFETVLLPRIKKVVFCEQWKDGKPNGGNGVSHFFKYQYLEQYEDTLNNLELRREADGQLALEQLGDEYLLRYMLDFETQGSPCLLDLEQFKDPFAYKLKVQEGDKIQERTVDLVETFNYLLGIHVKTMRQFEDNGRLYRAVLGEKEGRSIVIVWRSVVGLENDPTALQQDREFIEKTLLPDLLGGGKKPDQVFANGICFVPGVEAIEPEFKRLMWQEGQNGQEA